MCGSRQMQKVDLTHTCIPQNWNHGAQFKLGVAVWLTCKEASIPENHGIQAPVKNVEAESFMSPAN